MSVKEKVTALIRNRATSLPTLPVVVHNIIATARDQNTSAKDLAEFISNDQAISTRVLRVANSAYYGMSREIDSISRAIVIIGFKEVISLTLGMGVFSALSKECSDTLIDMPEMWKHSIGVGFAVKKILKAIQRPADESTLLMGLLHDTGKIIFCLFLHDEYETVLKEAHDRRTALCKAEKEHFGLDHAEMAYVLMDHWNFPEHIIRPVRHHHNLFRCPPGQADMARVLTVGDFICHRSGIGHSSANDIELDDNIWKGLRLSHDLIDSLTEELASEREKVEEFLTAIS